MNKLIIAIALFASASAASAQDAGEVQVLPPKGGAVLASNGFTTSSELVNSCKVTFPNGMETPANCNGLIAVIDPRGKLQCAPRANIINKGGQFFFLKNPKDAGERVTPCKDGAKVQS
jgi:hypothetical protein